MEERKQPPVQRGNIDGIRPRPKSNVENQPVPAPQSQPAADPQVPGQEPPVEQKTEKPARQKPKKNKNLFVIILAIIVLIGLSAFAVYTGLQQISDASNKQSNEQAGPGQENTPADNKQLIDLTVKEIDQLNDKSDTSGEGLSDEQLGL